MGRNNKVGLAYYAVDTDRYSDIKIKKLKKNCGASGVAIYDYILAEIYRDKGSYIKYDMDMVFNVAEYWNLTEKEIVGVVAECLEAELFSPEMFKKGYLTSRSIQVKYSEVCTASRRKCMNIPEEIRINTEEMRFITEERPFTHAESTQSKVKESKVDERKNFANNVGFSWQCEKDELWRSEACRMLKIQNRDIQGLLQMFTSHLITTDTVSQSLKDFKGHFLSWMRKRRSSVNTSGTLSIETGQ